MALVKGVVCVVGRGGMGVGWDRGQTERPVVSCECTLLLIVYACVYHIRCAF